MAIPPKNAAGKRMTINRGLSKDEQVWHFRSAWNVAALNCLGERYRPILEGYRSYILDNERALKGVNDRVEREYRRREKSRRAALLAREEHMTKVYNFFALPSARAGFCSAMLDISNRLLAAPPSDPSAFALANWDNVEGAFDTFFSDYETYQRSSAEWDAKWGDLYGPSQPGWVAVQEARANGVEVPSAEDNDPTDTLANPADLAGTITDPETGAKVPVIPVDERTVSQPITEPLPTGGGGATGG
jgi:hypothetical protein